jgi:hypothetical protein
MSLEIAVCCSKVGSGVTTKALLPEQEMRTKKRREMEEIRVNEKILSMISPTFFEMQGLAKEKILFLWYLIPKEK